MHELKRAEGPTMTLSIGRRRFFKWLVAGTLFGGYRIGQIAAANSAPALAGKTVKLKVAAVQMAPKLGDVEANLAQAERLIREAAGKGAEWVVLPEMFSSAAAFHESMIGAIRPVDGAPAKLLADLSKKQGLVLGGSFLARDGSRVFNSFLLVFPDGTVLRHDKDFPTYWETCYYEGGNDDGVLETPAGPVGVALCWEMVRSRTAKRLSGRVGMLLAGSTWWTLRDGADPGHPLAELNLRMLQEAPPRLARMLGVPVVHGSHAGPFRGFDSPELPDVPYDSVYLGEAVITDSAGNLLARRGLDEGAGVVTAEIELPAASQRTEAIPERFWLPEEMPQEWKESWDRWFTRGEDYYRTVTLPYLETGEIEEYVPPYLR